MPSRQEETVAFLARVATAFDGAVLGIAVAVLAASSWDKYFARSDALARIRAAPSASVSDLRSLLSDDDDGGGGRLVVVRGQAQPISTVDSSWLGHKHHDTLVAPSSGETALIVQHSATVPFVLVEGGKCPNSGYIHVTLGRSTHSLPLTFVYHQLRPVQSPSYSLFWAMFGHAYPVALLDEEKILPVGKDITAVGICSTRDGALEIESCTQLPCFLSDMTKEEVEADLAFNTKILFWSGVVLGTLSLGILGYAIIRNWQKWRAITERRQNQGLLGQNFPQSSADDELIDVPEEELCVICLMRQRICAFIPCGHRVCCQSCAMSVRIKTFPKCPVCHQDVRSSIRIYNS